MTRDDIVLDTEPPHSQVIFINRNAEVATSVNVTLMLRSEDLYTGVHLMSFSSDGVNWTDWEDYVTTDSKRFVLLTGDGTKTVYFKTKDRAGNEAEPVFDTIDLVTKAPAVDDDRPAEVFNTDVEGIQLELILFIILIVLIVLIISMYFYRRHKEKIEREKKAVERTAAPARWRVSSEAWWRACPGRDTTRRASGTPVFRNVCP